MGLESMNVKIGADLSGLAKGGADASKIITDIGNSAAQITPSLTKTAAAADALGTSLSKVANPGQSNSLPEYFKKTSEEAVKSGENIKRTHEGITAGSQNAKYAVLDLGHVFRDLPFALSNPAILSGPFDRAVQALTTLKQTTSETGQSMGSLIKGALVGPGGILIAVELVTSALAIFGPEIIKAFKGGASAVDELRTNTKLLTEVQQEANKEAGKQIVDARILYDTATNVNVAMADRLDAVKTLKKEFPDFFSQIKNETILNGQAKGSYDSLTKSILENARGLAARNKLADIESQRLDIDFQKQKIRNATNQELSAAKGASFTDESGRQIVDFTKKDAQKVIEIRRDAALKDQDDKDKILARQADFLTKFAGGESKIAAAVTDDTTFGKAPKAKAHVKDLDDVLKELNNDLALSQKLADIGFISSSEQDIAKIQKTKAAIEEILKLKKGPGVNSSIVTDLITSIQPEEARAQLTERSKEIVKTLKTVSGKELYQASDAIEVKIPVSVKPTINTDNALNLLAEKIKEDFNKVAKDIQKSVLDSGISSIGDLIGKAIGGGDVRGAFTGLLQTVISGMKQLGEAMIGLGTAKSVLEKFNIAPGIGTVIAGVGVIALSSLLQSALPKFAGGVTGFGGGMAIVGERGPEMVRLPQGSDVIPNHRLNSITGGGVQVFIPNLTFRGSDMLIQFNRANQQSRRNG